jgi:midasin
MSLAEDAVLERLNSLLEPSRTIILAEKGTDLANGVDSASLEIKAHDDFRIFATMNPGGDFGKRELSPALRNRFTEIWVPPIVDRCDIDLVLERSLASAFEESRSTYEIRLRACMLDYVEWFNNHLYTAFKSPKCELVLSLRDVLTWATFIVQQKRDVIEVELWMPYLQGAYLMHLDGLGLGTGLSREEANDIKQSATQILEDQLVRTGSNMSAIMSPSEPTCFWSRDHGKYGMHPFFISAGPYPVLSPLNFNFNAPTTRANILRVLRAMQLSKPILLEGSPGTGKTSLIAALAYATGHKLVRINLSEQTDWSDLMGSDLPVSDDGERGSGPNFKWCDGILLTAIKNGDWVVLDELNLATQSVLEGLNSCLDHRASVYIPELAMTYSCPKTFRVFAAQNPLIQGGGRKGLPKSFLNRFTKVYVESMTREDYFSIMSTKFPSIPTMVLQQMIEFNSKLENDIVTDKLYGQLGSPWEFNLRDLFRWGDL